MLYFLERFGEKIKGTEPDFEDSFNLITFCVTLYNHSSFSKVFLLDTK